MKTTTLFLQLRWSVRASLGLTIGLMALGTARLSAATDTNDYTEKLARGRYFPQRLVWLGDKAPGQEESKGIWEDFGGEKLTAPAEALPLLEGFLKTHPDSPWGPSLRLHLGEYYNKNGYFSLALGQWETVWNSTKGMKETKAAMVANSALVDWLQLLASLGRTDKMKALFEETRDRPLGMGRGRYDQLRMAYLHMLNHPEDSYRCGTYALDAVTKALYGTNNYWGLHKQQSPETGFSMAELVRLSESNHLGLAAVERPSGAELVSPSVVHWKENHYAAIVEQKGDKYLVVDPTFQIQRWLTAEAINHEASGQFLVPAQKTPAGWRNLDANEEGQIFGKGFPSGIAQNPAPPCKCPPCVCPPGAGGTGAGGGGEPFQANLVQSGGGGGGGGAPTGLCPTCYGTPGGMPVWEVTEPEMSLWLEDEPLAYQTATGGRFSFKMYFNTYLSVAGGSEALGNSWNNTWNSDVDAANWPATVSVATPGGGSTTYSNLDGTVPEFYSNNRMLTLTNSNGIPGAFEVIHPSGAIDVYAGYASSSPWYCFYFMTQQIDAQGRTTTFVYDTNAWVVTNVVDADGMTNILTYTNSGQQIAQIQDPYGHVVSFLYDDASTDLTNVVDVAGLSTGFEYDGPGAGVTKMITPYGATGFDFIPFATSESNDVGYTYGIISEPNGARQIFVAGLGYGFAEVPQVYTDTGNVPTNRPPDNAGGSNTLDNPDWNNPSATNYMNLGNTFYWNRQQSANLPTNFLASGPNWNFDLLTTNDYANARMRHWLQDINDGETRLLSMERQPSPDGVTPGKMTWWDYPGKPEYYIQGSSAFPSMVVKVLPDGSEAYAIYQVDQWGNRTNIISTYSQGGTVLTRTNRAVYAANGEDLLQVIGPDGVTNAAYGYNTNHQVLFMTNAVGDVTSYTYNTSAQLTSVKQPTGLVTTNIYGANGFLATNYNYAGAVYFGTNSYTYTNGLVLTHTDERGLTVTNSWDSLQRLTKVAYPDGTAISYTYSNLDLVRVVDRMGFTNAYDYNSIRQKVAETNALGYYNLYDYCLCGALDSIRDALGNYTYFNYDNAGRATNTVYPDGYSVTNRYDSVGRITNVVDVGGVSVTNWFNNQGLVVAVSNAVGRVRSVTYDINDRATNVVDGNGVVTTNGYDRLGRVLARGVAGGGVENFGYTAAGLVFYTNQLGYVTTNGYDAEGRKIAETNANGQVTQYGYDAASDLTSLTDGSSHTTQWGYDLYGRVTNKVDANGTNILKYQYDADSRLTNRWTLGRTNTAYAYDKVGNLTGVTYQASHALTFAYDPLNRLTNMTDAVGTTTFSYTAAGQLASENGPWPSDQISYTYANRQRTGLSLEQPNAAPLAETYAYDGASRLTSITAPPGVFGYQYASGAQGLVSKISLPITAYVSNFYDGLARLTNTTLFNSTNSALDYIGYSYNNANQRTEQWRGAATTNTAVSTNYANYTYDPIGQLTSDLAAELIGSTNRMNEQLHYAYDAAGNLNYRTNNTLVENFQVNSVNELTTGTNGGRLTVMGTTSSQATNVTVNGTNALLYGDATFASTNMPLTTTYTAIAKDAYGRINTNTATVSLSTNSTFQYDLNGNLTNDGTMSFAYDDENQLTQVWVPNQWFSQFTYDGKMRRRIRQEYTWSGGWVQTNIVYYVYDGNMVIQERDINYLPTVTYTRGQDLSGSLDGAGGIGGLLARTDNDAQQAAFYHADGNGNVTMLINSYQAVVAKYLYDAFGNTLSLSGPIAYANLYRFSSKEAHQNSGLVYYLYRYYDPNLQRWPSRDPIGLRGGKNLYAFCFNSPVNMVDRLGAVATFEYASDGEAYYNGGLFWDTKSDSGFQENTSAAFFQVSAVEQNGSHGICDSGLAPDDGANSFVKATVKNVGDCSAKLYCVCNISWSATTSNTGAHLASGGFVKGTILGKDFYQTLDPSPSVTGAGTWGTHSEGHFAAHAAIKPTVGGTTDLYYGTVSVSAPPDAPGSTIFATMSGSCTCR